MEHGFAMLANGTRLREYTGQVAFEFGFDVAASGDNGSRKTTLTAYDVVGDVFRLWGMCCDKADGYEPCIRNEAVSAVNAALQFIHANGKQLPYLTTATRLYLVSGDTGASKAITFESDVQGISGQVRARFPGIYGSLTFRNFQDLAGMPYEKWLEAGATVNIPFEHGAEAVNISFTAGTDFTDEETLRRVLDARAVNGARAFVSRSGKGVTIAWDIPPVWDVEFMVAGKMRIEKQNGDWSYTDAAAGVWPVDGSTYVPANADAWQSGQPCSQVTSRYEFDNFAALYGGSLPACFFIEAHHNSAAANSNHLRMLINSDGQDEPAVWQVNVDLRAQRIEWNDVSTRAAVPIPHEYIESLLLPIARWHAKASRNYKARERDAAIEAQYQQALTMLGLVDPKTADQPEKDGKAE